MTIELEKLEAPTVIEQLTLREKFTDAEEKALIADGALVYTPHGTITAQKDSRAKKGKPAFWYIVNARNRIHFVPSTQVQVAIYPDPNRIFVPGSFNKSLRKQEELVAADAAALRQRLGLEGIGEIIPDEASTITDIVFQHEEATGKWLFGPEYAAAQRLNWVYARTKHPTNHYRTYVTHVGDAHPERGVSVYDWSREGGNHDVGALRMVVPIEAK